MMMSLNLLYIIALTFRICDVFLSSSFCFQKISADLSRIYNELICAKFQEGNFWLSFCGFKSFPLMLRKLPWW